MFLNPLKLIPPLVTTSSPDASNLAKALDINSEFSTPSAAGLIVLRMALVLSSMSKRKSSARALADASRPSCLLTSLATSKGFLLLALKG